MRLHDTLVGLIFMLLGVAAFAYGFSLVPPRHLPYGPGFFPQIVGAGMAVVGAVLAIRSIPKWRRGDIVWFPEWVRTGAGIMRFLSIPLAIVFFIFAVTPMGFPPTAWIILAGLFWSGGVRPLRALLVGLIIALLLTLMFASLLNVPLPWGVLAPISGWFL